ncbi:2-keto-4-pentenoate hydratase [Neoroseomonas lacus]|uniref:Fumarylacetoacetate (FAA) hydrolase n=1 Tax=Neoroseomonas lacus TaxID=287609 RepID=A0A917KRJ0_9PROT|nr:fumarylacetoacetate hydrolase family protein [Neoroseomonas lacus]GGJ24442.1 fumarylacetoacetate (FAA) hydrolase [Neoroseomonas lacus]
MTPAEADVFALLLASARRDGRQVMPPAILPATPQEGYDVADAVAAQLGWPRRGWKVAATTPEMRRRLRASEPTRGPIYARFVQASPAVLPFASLLDPLIECEIVLRLGVDLPARPEPWTAPEVQAAIAGVHGGIEVAECRFPIDALPAMPAILADGAANGRYVLGAEIAGWRDGDLAAMPVTLAVDGAVRRSGTGAEAMGHPFHVLLWLAEALRQRGQGLAVGDLVSSGTCTGMLRPAAGQRLLARFGESCEVALDLR